MKSGQVTSTTMNGKALQALASLRATLADADGFTSCHTFLGTQVGQTKSDRWQRVQFSPALATSYRESLIRKVAQDLPSEEMIVPFTYEETTASQVPVLQKEEFPNLADWLDEVPEPQWPYTFKGDEGFLESVKVHVAVLSGISASSDLKVFRRRSSATIVKKRGVLGSFTASKHEFDVVKDKIFDFPTDAEFLEWDGFVFVLNIVALEALTDIREITNTQAKKAIASIKAIKGLEVVGLEAVEASLELRPRLAKRLAAAGKHNIFHAIKLDTLKAHINQYGLSLNAESKNGKISISFNTDSRVQIEEFVNLVADVYLRSSSTGLDYKAHSKELIKKK